MSYSHCNKSLDWIQRAESMYVEYFQYSMNSASEPVGCVKIKPETLPNEIFMYVGSECMRCDAAFLSLSSLALHFACIHTYFRYMELGLEH